jgi:hypothetical protein
MNIAVSEKLVRRGRGLFVDLLVLILTNRGRNRRKMDLPRALLWLSSTYQVLSVEQRSDWFALPGATDSRVVAFWWTLQLHLLGHGAFPSVSSVFLLILRCQRSELYL